LTKEILLQFVGGIYSTPGQVLVKSIKELERLNKEGTDIKYAKSCPGFNLNEEEEEDPIDIEIKNSRTRRLIDGRD
jgi:hypothetical protein